MRTPSCATLALTVLLLGAPVAAWEKKIQMQNLPPAVQKAVQEHSQAATIRGLAKEVENGKTLYEAELLIEGRTRDITFDSEGTVVSLEQEVPIESLPAPARDAIRKAAGTRKVLMLESVTAGGATFYEARVKKGPWAPEIRVDAGGRPVK